MSRDTVSLRKVPGIHSHADRGLRPDNYQRREGSGLVRPRGKWGSVMNGSVVRARKQVLERPKRARYAGRLLVAAYRVRDHAHTGSTPVRCQANAR